MLAGNRCGDLLRLMADDYVVFRGIISEGESQKEQAHYPVATQLPTVTVPSYMLAEIS